jgi:hypothetical protein
MSKTEGWTVMLGLSLARHVSFAKDKLFFIRAQLEIVFLSSGSPTPIARYPLAALPTALKHRSRGQIRLLAQA